MHTPSGMGRSLAERQLAAAPLPLLGALSAPAVQAGLPTSHVGAKKRYSPQGVLDRHSDSSNIRLRHYRSGSNASSRRSARSGRWPSTPPATRPRSPTPPPTSGPRWAVPFGNCTEPSNVKAGGGHARSASSAPAAASTAPTPPTCPPSNSTSPTASRPRDRAGHRRRRVRASATSPPRSDSFTDVADTMRRRLDALPCTVPKPRRHSHDLQVRPPAGPAMIMQWPYACST